MASIDKTMKMFSAILIFAMIICVAMSFRANGQISEDVNKWENVGNYEDVEITELMKK